MVTSMKWQDWANFLLGLWLFASPWVLGYADLGQVTVNALIFGFLLVVFSLLPLKLPAVWEEWIDLLCGLWLIAAPFVLGFTGQFSAAVNSLLVGTLVALLAAWAMSLDREIVRWWHDRAAGH
ncbi:MAG: SPW repeat protein [Burkholderiales bacterium]|nr:SPW repeat protein [Burkholderiales bacterium]